MEKKIPEKIIVDSIEEEEKEIYRLRLEQVPQNKITQIECIVNGVSRHHNPSDISKITKKFENKNSENVNDDSYKEAKVLEIFVNGGDRIQAKIQTRYDTELIERVWELYVKWRGIRIIPKSIYDELMESTLKFDHHFNDPKSNMSEMSIELMNEYFRSSVDDDVTLY